jgi:uncharacterized membrane protein
MNTAAQQYSKHVSVPSGEGARVDKAITIERPIAEVYDFWRQLENLPRFMRHLQSVTVLDNLHSRWIAKTVAGKLLKWDAEIIEQRQNEMISWRSAPGADVDNAGSVWFTKVPNGQGTLVRVELKYLPAAGKTGELIAKAFGRDADSAIEEDLYRLKSLLETGRVPQETTARGLQRATNVIRNLARSSDTRIRENPWTSMTTIALVGFALGLLLGLRRRSRRAHYPRQSYLD